MVLAVLLDALLRNCASAVGPRTMTAIVRVESGGNALAMHDNTVGRSLLPQNRATAVAWADELIALGHSVDLGLAQVNSANLAPLGLTTNAAFDPCANLRGGATILHDDYQQALAQYGPGQTALRHAIGAYNSGSIFAGGSYLDRILAAAGFPAPDVTMPDLLPQDATQPLAAGAPTTQARTGAAAPRRVIVTDGATLFRRAKAPPVTRVTDAAQPQMIVVGASAPGPVAAAAPVVIVGH